MKKVRNGLERKGKVGMRISEEDLQEGTKVELGRILNKDLFLFLLDLEVKRARRYQNFLCLLLLKLEQFTKKDDNGEGFQPCYEVLTDLLTVEMRESDVLGSLGKNRLAVLLPYANGSAGRLARSRFENILGYFSFQERGYKVIIDQICFPINGTDTIDLIKKALGTETL